MSVLRTSIESNWKICFKTSTINWIHIVGCTFINTSIHLCGRIYFNFWFNFVFAYSPFMNLQTPNNKIKIKEKIRGDKTSHNIEMIATPKQRVSELYSIGLINFERRQIPHRKFFIWYSTKKSIKRSGERNDLRACIDVEIFLNHL